MNPEASAGDLDLFKQIAGTAFELWNSFLEYSRRSYHPVNLFTHDYRLKVNKCVASFLQYCAEVTLREDPGIGPAARTAIVFHSLSGERQRDKPVSWLWRQRGVPKVVIDKEVLFEKLSASALSRAITRIILHEIGHVVRHWEALRPPGAVDRQLSAAKPEHEAEAWWFGQAVVGSGIGALAQEHRERGGFDQAWPHS